MYVSWRNLHFTRVCYVDHVLLCTAVPGKLVSIIQCLLRRFTPSVTRYAAYSMRYKKPPHFFLQKTHIETSVTPQTAQSYTTRWQNPPGPGITSSRVTGPRWRASSPGRQEA